MGDMRRGSDGGQSASRHTVTSAGRAAERGRAYSARRFSTTRRCPASGKQSCASCHSPHHAYGPPNKLVRAARRPAYDWTGYRPPPSLTYLYRQAPIQHRSGSGRNRRRADRRLPSPRPRKASQRAQKNAGVAPAAPAMVPQGGFFWDGRARHAAGSGARPDAQPGGNGQHERWLESPHKLQRTRSTSERFKQLFGPHDRPRARTCWSRRRCSRLRRYQIEDPSFHAVHEQVRLLARRHARA